ncbi:UDP-glucose:O-linked fucose beta-1,3-glucosyltransferase [Sarotherodon galilaeus]
MGGRWGQRAISRALQTSLGGETLSTVSAGAEQGSPGNKERHKLSSPLHPAAVEDYRGELTLTGRQTAPADSSFPQQSFRLGTGIS